VRCQKFGSFIGFNSHYTVLPVIKQLSSVNTVAVCRYYLNLDSCDNIYSASVLE